MIINNKRKSENKYDILQYESKAFKKKIIVKRNN